MNYKLYQIDLEKDTERYAFMGQEFLDELGLCFPPPRELYSLTYEGNCTDINPEELFYLLNVDHPDDYRTRSLSVGDVIVYTWDGNELPLFCDSFGFLPILFSDTETWPIWTNFQAVEDNGFIWLRDNREDFISIRIDSLLAGVKQYRNQNNEFITLSPAQFYAALSCFYLASGGYRNNGKPKSLEEWTKSGMPDFDWYALPGDIVDKAIYSNFLGILPPAYMEAGYLQVGEALEHLPDKNGVFKATYLTFAESDGTWRYLGHCFYRETENQWQPASFLQQLNKLLG